MGAFLVIVAGNACPEGKIGKIVTNYQPAI
jgi:hypothetical protein